MTKAHEGTVQFLSDLTPREQQIIRAIMQGDSPKEAAYDIGISYKTLNVYLFNAYKKCGVHSLVELICKLYEVRERVSPAE